MPSFGGMMPYPRRLGGGRPRLQDCLDGLNADRGDAFDTSNTQSVVYVENMAIARAVNMGWGTNERLGHLWDAQRMPEDVVVRWEKILALAPAPDDTMQERRDRLQLVFERFGQPAISSALTTTLQEELGDAFVAVEYIDYDDALIQVPDGTYPWGIVDSSPWSSTVAHVLVRLQKPTGWSEADFQEAAGKVSLILEPALPVWTTFAWYRPGASSVAVGGVSAAGFYLDTVNNLDNQIFAS